VVHTQEGPVKFSQLVLYILISLVVGIVISLAAHVVILVAVAPESEPAPGATPGLPSGAACVRVANRDAMRTCVAREHAYACVKPDGAERWACAPIGAPLNSLVIPVEIPVEIPAEAP
jgi:hypothetical protein